MLYLARSLVQSAHMQCHYIGYMRLVPVLCAAVLVRQMVAPIATETARHDSYSCGILAAATVCKQCTHTSFCRDTQSLSSSKAVFPRVLLPSLYKQSSSSTELLLRPVMRATSAITGVTRYGAWIRAH
jgi:hypothetical protein